MIEADLLHDIVRHCLETPHVVAIDDIDHALLAGANQQMRIGTRLIGQNIVPPEPRSVSALASDCSLNGVKESVIERPIAVLIASGCVLPSGVNSRNESP